MAKGKVNSFLVAVLLAIASFFVIFLFFPEASDKFFGVSLKHGDAEITSFKNDLENTISSGVSNVTKTVGESVVKTVTDGLSNVKDAVSEDITENVSDVVEDIKDTLADSIKNLITSGK